MSIDCGTVVDPQVKMIEKLKKILETMHIPEIRKKEISLTNLCWLNKNISVRIPVKEKK